MILPLLTKRRDTLFYNREQGTVHVLDRRRYPHEIVFVVCHTLQEVVAAISDMVVQGGPPLAYVAGYGLVLVARQHRTWPAEQQRNILIQAAEMLRDTRPTADDVHHVLDIALHYADHALLDGDDAEQTLADVVDRLVRYGDGVAEACGRYAADLLADGERILTHCFAGAALNWMLAIAHGDQGKRIHLYANETRPYLQGARLTAHQAHEIGVQVTLLTDNMAGYCFRQNMFTSYITAADRIALDGSIANKIGTYQYAVLAHRHHVPFYVLGYDGPDPNTATGADIPIEERDPHEVLHCAGQRTAPLGVGAFYPAFDVTPPELITAIITDRGVFKPSDVVGYDFDYRWHRHLLS